MIKKILKFFDYLNNLELTNLNFSSNKKIISLFEKLNNEIKLNKNTKNLLSLFQKDNIKNIDSNELKVFIFSFKFYLISTLKKNFYNDLLSQNLENINENKFLHNIQNNNDIKDNILNYHYYSIIYLKEIIDSKKKYKNTLEKLINLWKYLREKFKNYSIIKMKVI